MIMTIIMMMIITILLLMTMPGFPAAPALSPWHWEWGPGAGAAASSAGAVGAVVCVFAQPLRGAWAGRDY